jgi:hypothetical protein
MIANQDDESLVTSNALANLNLAIAVIFMTELVLKLLAFDRAYFLSGWHLFDFLVVMASVVDIVLSNLNLYNRQSKAFSFLPQIARIFRVLRLTRVLRMFKSFK